LLTVPTWRYVQLQPLDDAERILGFDNGDAALLARQVGSGRCLLLATAADPGAVDRASEPAVPWSALATWPSFPPLMHEMLKSAVQGRQTRWNRLVGEGLQGPLPDWTAAARATLTLPDDAEVALEVDSARVPPRFSYFDTFRSGVYRVTMQGSPQPDGSTSQIAAAPQIFAVNVDPREGQLERYDAALLPSQFTASQPATRASEDTALPAAMHSWYRVCLAALLALVLTETALGRWFGQRVS
jgi:hypothetical protein